MAEAAPADVGHGAEVVGALLRIVGVVDEHRCPAEIRARHETVVPAIDRLSRLSPIMKKVPGARRVAPTRGGSE